MSNDLDTYRRGGDPAYPVVPARAAPRGAIGAVDNMIRIKP